MRIVLTRERGRNERLREWLPVDSDVTEVPVTTTHYVDDDEVTSRVRASGSWGDFATLVVTSARSARYVGTVRSALVDNVECFSVGAQTSLALADAGLHVSAQSAGGSIDLVRQITRSPVLVLGAATMRDELATALRDVDVVVVACYETQRVTLDDAGRAALAAADAVLVGAPSAWSVLRDDVAASAWVVVPGPTTAEVVRATHPRVLEGWGPSLRERLLASASDAER